MHAVIIPWFFIRIMQDDGVEQFLPERFPVVDPLPDACPVEAVLHVPGEGNELFMRMQDHIQQILVVEADPFRIRQEISLALTVHMGFPPVTQVDQQDTGVEIRISRVIVQ